MKHLTKAINRLAKAMEIQNKQLEKLRGNDTSKDIIPMMMLAMMFNSPYTKPDIDCYKLQEELKSKDKYNNDTH